MLGACSLVVTPCLAQAGKACMQPVPGQENARRILLKVNVWSIRWVSASREEKYGIILPGGWREIPVPVPVLRRTVMQRVARIGSEGLRIRLAPVAAIRPAIRQWLARHGIADMPDTDLHHIESGLTLEASSRPGDVCMITVKPWLRLRKPAQPQVGADMEMLPALGRSDAPARPPATSAPLRLNLSLHPGRDTWHYIPIPGATTWLYLRMGKQKALLAAENEAKGIGDIILSTQLNGSNRHMVIGLGLPAPKHHSSQASETGGVVR